MRIESITIDGFGCLRDCRFDFPPDKAVLIVEENESGKSTLVAAILAGLCGFAKNKRNGDPAKYKPWDSDSYSVEMELEAGGEHFVVTRDFSRQSFGVRHRGRNENIHSGFDSDLAAHFLKLPMEDFVRVAVISGKEAGRFSSSVTLNDRLSSLVEGSSDDSTTEAAVSALKGAKMSWREKPILPATVVKRISEEIEAVMATVERLDSEMDAAAEETARLDALNAAAAQLNNTLELLDNEYADALKEEESQRVDDTRVALLEAREAYARSLSDLKSRHERLETEKRVLTGQGIDPDATGEAEKVFGRLADSDRDTLRRHQAIALEIQNRIAAAERERESAAAGLGDIKRKRSSHSLAGRALSCCGVVAGIALGLTLGWAWTSVGTLLLLCGIVLIIRAASLDADSRVSLQRAMEHAATGISGAESARADLAACLVRIARTTGYADADAASDAFGAFERALPRLSEITRLRGELDGYRGAADRAREALGNQVCRLVGNSISDDDLLNETQRLLADMSARSGRGGETAPRRLSSEVDAERAARRSELDETNKEILALERVIGGRVDAYKRDYPVAREELAELHLAHRRAIRYQEALAAAASVMTEVSEATRRRWASALNDQVSAILPRLNPDYDNPVFDDSLNLSLRRVSDGRLLDRSDIDGRLSTGARDQIYLAVRLACCLELSGSGEPLPIILDDPFMAADDERFESGLEYVVRDLVPRLQVIILSCHGARHRAALAGSLSEKIVSVVLP